MAQKPGKSGRTRGLVDMTVEPAAYLYRPPSNAEPLEYRSDLGEGSLLIVRQSIYRGKVVDFAFTQCPPGTDGHEPHVYRIDCCHGEVHSHQYFRNGDEERRTVIQSITDRRTAWETVDTAFYECNDRIHASWHANFERWAG